MLTINNKTKWMSLLKAIEKHPVQKILCLMITDMQFNTMCTAITTR